MTCCIMALRTSILLCILVCICPFSFSPYFSSKISPQLYKIKSSFLVYRITAISFIIGQITSFVLFVHPYICYLFFLSMQSILQFFVIDFSATFRNRRLIFYMYIDNDLLLYIVGLRTGILLIILPCICPFFFLSTFL